MITHKIPLESFLSHGKITTSVENSELHMTTNIAINTLFMRTDTPIKSYIYLPKKYKLPFKIDMTVSIDSPALYLLVGNGHVAFATGQLDNRRITDITGGDFKPYTNAFDNDIPINKFIDISVIYGRKAMQVIVNDEVRCFSTKDKYIKEKEIPEEFKEGFTVGIACDKRTKLTLKSVTITEYENEEPSFSTNTMSIKTTSPSLSVSEKPTIEECIKGLVPELQHEILLIDNYLRETLKRSMKFKRKIEGGYPCSKITYVSPWGFSYKIRISGAIVSHDMGWIGYNTKREREKYGGIKKADYSIETLEKLAETSSEFADEIFLRIKECTGCYGSGCMGRTHYEYKGQKKVSCGGNMHFKMFASDFTDVRKVIEAINEVVAVSNAV